MCRTPTIGDLTLRDVNAGCSCCSSDAAADAASKAANDTVSETFLVSGMTCGHCVASVREELADLDGVTAVQVDLVAGGTSRVTVSSETPLKASAVDAAVREAGYELVVQ